VLPVSAPDALPGLEPWHALETLTTADADRFRFVVTPDTDADGPLEWGGVTCVPVHEGSNRSDGTPSGGSDPLHLADALERFGEGVVPVVGRWRNTDGAADALIRWARIFHGREVARWQCNVSQSTWVDALVYLEEEADRGNLEALTATVETLSAWARGEVYGVRLERNVTASADAMVGEYAPVWVDVEECDVWGVYLDRTYTPADLAAQQFGVPLEFARAVDVVDSWDA
jgi:hypothetical protein